MLFRSDSLSPPTTTTPSTRLFFQTSVPTRTATEAGHRPSEHQSLAKLANGWTRSPRTSPRRTQIGLPLPRQQRYRPSSPVSFTIPPHNLSLTQLQRRPLPAFERPTSRTPTQAHLAPPLLPLPDLPAPSPPLQSHSRPFSYSLLTQGPRTLPRWIGGALARVGTPNPSHLWRPLAYRRLRGRCTDRAGSAAPARE